MISQKPWTKPNGSFVIRANAGSGKTTVLIERILVLLLSGIKPSKILCITYTTAGASEVYSRINAKIKELILWLEGDAGLQPKALDYLAELGFAFKPEHALRQLKQIKTSVTGGDGGSSGLEICTFHAFCLKILTNFSGEAGLGYKINLLQDDSLKAKEMLNEVKHKIFADPLFSEENFAIVQYCSASEQGTDGLIAEIMRHRSKFVKINYAKQEAFLCDNFYDASLLQNCSLDDYFYLQLQSVDIDTDEIASLVTDHHIQNAITKYYKSKSYDNFIAIFLTKNEPRKALLKSPFAEAAQKIAKIANDKTLCKEALKNKAIYTFAVRVISLYQQIKQEAGLVDFEDIVLKTINLLNNADDETREWIAFKLGDSIEHILVDESQDTNANQWSVIFEGLFSDFFNDTQTSKSLFVVGDDKQMIYSFQGSEPGIFSKMLSLKTNGDLSQQIEDVRLEKNYRSSPLILRFVDEVFKNPQIKQIYNLNVEHEAAKTELGGFIKLLAPNNELEKTKSQKPEEPSAVFFKKKTEENLAKQNLAIAVCDCVKHLVFNQQIKPCDIMMLAKKRDPKLFEALSQQLHICGLEAEDISSKTLSSLAPVQDLVNLLRLAFLKDDDENIYALLQSNLCGFSSKEEMLFCLAKKDISQTLGQSFTIADAILCFADDCSDEAKVSKSLMLKAMQLLLDGDDFFKDIALSGMGASLQKLCSICALIAKNTELDFLSLLDTLMLSFEEFYAPNELKLLSYLEAKAAEYHNTEPSAEPLGFILFYDKIKNQSIKNPSLALGEGVVRLSTIHSAKGLESKVVILLDADAKKGTNSKKELIFDEENGVFFMEPSATCKFKDTSVAWQIIKKYNLATKTEELNLLYVALTRAKQALFIFTSEKLKEEDTKKKTKTDNPNTDTNTDSWSCFILPAIEAIGGTGQQIAFGNWLDEDGSKLSSNPQNTSLQEFLNHLNANLQWDKSLRNEEPKLVSFTSLQGGVWQGKVQLQSISAEDDLDVRQKGWEAVSSLSYGQAMHTLCELESCIQNQGDCHEVLRLKNYHGNFDAITQKFFNLKQTLAWIFDKKQWTILSEANVSAAFNTKVHFGRPDRILFNKNNLNDIKIIDFKTHSGQPKDDLLKEYKKQLLFYKEILQNIYKDGKIECYIVLTNDATCIKIDV